MRKFLPVLAAVFLLFLLPGCHGPRDSSVFVVPEQLDPGRTYEVTFWAKNDTNKVQVAIYKQAVEDFMALYPNIKVTIKYYTDYAMIYQDVITNIATGTTPNVCITYPEHITTYLTGNNVVVPIGDLMRDRKYGLGGTEILFDAPTMNEIVPEYLEECKIGGAYYALPFMRSTEACYINQDLVEALGYKVPDVLTWDFIFEVSDKAMEKNADGTFKVNGQTVMIPFIYKSTDNMMIQMLHQLDAPYSTDKGDVLIFNDTTEELLLEIEKHAGLRSFSTFGVSSYPGNKLNIGQCIFAVDSTAGATWMGADAPLSDIHDKSELRSFRLAVRPVPQFHPDRLQMISQGPSVCIFNKEDPEEVLASWIFAQFLLTNEVQYSYSETEGYVPVTLKAREDPAYQDYLSREGEDNDTYYAVKIQAAKLLLRNAENTFVTPVFNVSASLRQAAGAMIESVTKAARRKQTVDHAYIETLYSDTTSLYRLDQIDASGTGEGVKKDLGALDPPAVALLAGLAAAWVLILVFFLVRTVIEAVERRKTA